MQQHESAMKSWMIVTVETELEWPAEETSVELMGHTLILRPPNGDSAADVRLHYEHPEGEHAAFETICRFLSALSWWERRPAKMRLRLGCSAPMRVGKGGHGPPLHKDYQLSDGVAVPTDPKARIALALYREAVSVGNISYEFLGYFKIINTRYSSSKAQIAWINRTIPLLNEHDASKRISDLTATHGNIGDYLYVSGRCAVAHAFNNPVVDPDKPDDVFRLSADMPVAKALAEYLIENEYAIQGRFSK